MLSLRARILKKMAEDLLWSSVILNISALLSQTHIFSFYVKEAKDMVNYVVFPEGGYFL